MSKKGLLEALKFGVYLAVPIGLAVAITVPSFRKRVLGKSSPRARFCVSHVSTDQLGLKYPVREERSQEQLKRLQEVVARKQ
jgi:hypothetical protein